MEHGNRYDVKIKRFDRYCVGLDIERCYDNTNFRLDNSHIILSSYTISLVIEKVWRIQLIEHVLIKQPKPI